MLFPPALRPVSAPEQLPADGQPRQLEQAVVPFLLSATVFTELQELLEQPEQAVSPRRNLDTPRKIKTSAAVMTTPATR